MVKTKQSIRRGGSMRYASTSTNPADYPHATVDFVAPEAPQRSEFLPATEVDDPSGLDVREQPPPCCPSTSISERKAYWMVDVIDEQGVKKMQKLRLHDVCNLPIGQKVVLPFDRFMCPTTDAAAIYAQFLGNCAKDTIAFPIHFEDWRKIPKTTKDKYFNDIILPKFHFENVDLERAMDYTRKIIGRKRQDYKLELWNFAYDPSLSIEEMQNKVPPGVDKDQWVCYVTYRFNDKTKEICKKNKENRKKLKVPHTGGSKSLPRRRTEMEIERGQPVDRGELYIVTHQKKDGTFINEQARIISEQIRQEMSRNPPTQSDTMSQNDALGKVLGREHPGRVRSMGFGPTPSSVFKRQTRAYGSLSSFSGSASSCNNSELLEMIRNLEAELQAERERRNALEWALKSSFEEILGRVPQAFADFISCSPTTQNDTSGDRASLSGSSSASHEPEHRENFPVGVNIVLHNHMKHLLLSNVCIAAYLFDESEILTPRFLFSSKRKQLIASTCFWEIQHQSLFPLSHV